MGDRTHWFGCWEHHHECALARIEQLEKALLKVKETALSAMEIVEDFEARLIFSGIAVDAEETEERE